MLIACVLKHKAALRSFRCCEDVSHFLGRFDCGGHRRGFLEWCRRMEFRFGRGNSKVGGRRDERHPSRDVYSLQLMGKLLGIGNNA